MPPPPTPEPKDQLDLLRRDPPLRRPQQAATGSALSVTPSQTVGSYSRLGLIYQPWSNSAVRPGERAIRVSGRILDAHQRPG